MADRAHKLTDKELAKMERHLTEIYQRANKELSEKADKYFAQFARLDEQKKALVEAGKMTEKEYRTWRQNKIMSGKHWTEMKEQTAQELLRVNQIAADYVNGRLPDVYALNYNAVGNGLESAVKGYSFELVDANTVKNLATSDKTLLPYKYVDGKKDVRWNTQKVNAEILQGIIQGESIPNIAKRLRNVTEMNKASAIRNARTTITSAENKGRMDMLHNAADKGVNAHKVWMATNDARTREAHAELDGQEQEIDNPFESELGDIMYPGDPEADPANVYNCRCTLTYKVVGFGEKGEEPISNAEPEQAYATSREEAYSLLTDGVGFHEVSPSMRYIDDETVIAQANQLSILNGKFHAIGDNYGGYIGAENSKSFVAATRGSFTNADSQNLIFSFNSYAHGYDKVISDVRKDILGGWSMPALEEKYGVYTVTHEYGHILQNVLMSQRIDIDAYNAAREKTGLNAAKLKKLKKKTEDEAAKGIFSEILGIAKEKNSNFSLKDNISGYGKSNYQEAFAEVFANSQLGKPNELGQAMLVWLERMGY